MFALAGGFFVFANGYGHLNGDQGGESRPSGSYQVHCPIEGVARFKVHLDEVEEGDVQQQQSVDGHLVAVLADSLDDAEEIDRDDDRGEDNVPDELNSLYEVGEE